MASPNLTPTNGAPGALGALLTPRDAARRLGVSYWHVLRLCLGGELQSLKIGTRPGQRGGKRLIPESEVNGWIARNLRAA